MDRNDKKDVKITEYKTDVNTEQFTREQKIAYAYLTKNIEEQKLLILNGTAGTGKSYLIRALATFFGDQIRITATTGVASFNIHGQTICSLLKLPIRKKNKNDLSGEQLTKLQSNLRNVKMIVVDEYTMLGCEALSWIDRRLKQGTGVSDKPFGGISIILVGDPGQLPPVMDAHLYNPKKNIESQAGHLLYTLFKNVIKLSVVKRQEGDDEDQQKFRDLLTRMRNNNCKKADVQLLQEQSYHKLVLKHGKEKISKMKMESLHLFPTRDKVKEHNMGMLQTLLNDTGDKAAVVKIEAKHSRKTGAKIPAEEFSGLENDVFLARGARVMLNINLWVEAGLVNGAKGTIIQIVYSADDHPPGLPRFVLVQFDEYLGPAFVSSIPRSVPIVPVTLRDDTCVHERTQLPLILAWAISIHKSQGSTLTTAVIDIGKKDFAPGLSFVALSRIKTLQNSIVEFITYKRLVKSKKSKAILLRESEERRLDLLNDKFLSTIVLEE